MKTFNKFKRWVLALIDNIQLTLTAASSIPNADPGKVRLFADIADGSIKWKDEHGVIPGGGGSNPTYHDIEVEIVAGNTVNNASANCARLYLDVADGLFKYKKSNGDIIIIGITLYDGANQGDVLTINAQGVPAWAAPAMPTDIPVANLHSDQADAGLILFANPPAGAAWGEIDALPVDVIQAGNNGEVLTTVAGETAWAAPAMPDNIPVANLVPSVSNGDLLKTDTGEAKWVAP